jgi:hypothetical protein
MFFEKMIPRWIKNTIWKIGNPFQLSVLNRRYMKNLLLLVVALVFWLSASAQGKGPACQSHFSAIFLLQNFPRQPEVIKRNPEKIVPGKVPPKSWQPVISSVFSPVQLLDSVYQWSWEPSFMEWMYDSRIKQFIYDEKNNLISADEEEWNTMWSIWENSSKLNITYDNKSNPLSLTIQYWNGTWVNDIQFLLTYDGNNNKTSELYQEWNGSSWDDIGLYSLSVLAGEHLV